MSGSGQVGFAMSGLGWVRGSKWGPFTTLGQSKQPGMSILDFPRGVKKIFANQRGTSGEVSFYQL